MKNGLRKRWIWLGGAAALGLASMTGCSVKHSGIRISASGQLGSNQVNETVEKRFQADKVNVLRVRATAGEIVIKPAEGGKEVIHIRATKYVVGDLAENKLQRHLAKLKTTAWLEDETLVVGSEYKGSRPREITAYVSYVITVPKRIALELASASGDITAQGMQGGVKIETASGDVELKDIAGALDIKTASGSISVNDSRVSERLYLESASGNIQAHQIHAAGNALKVGMTSQSGNLTFSGEADELKLETASGNIESEATAGIPLVSAEARSASGNIALAFPSSVSAKVDARSNSGDVDASAVNSKVSKDAKEETHSLSLTLGNGMAPITIETASGNIAIRTTE